MVQVVLIDDHRVILDGLAVLINSDSEFDVVGKFEDPDKALEYLDSHEVDVVLTDLDMPAKRGEDVLQYCKSKFPQLRVVILSMHNERGVIKHLIESGADGYILKTSGKEEILRTIRAVHSGSKYFSDEVMSSLLRTEAKPITNTIPDVLTNREIEIIRLIAGGMSSKQIGDELNISQRTVETHRNNILRKLNLKGVAAIVRFAFQHNMVE